MPQNNKIKIRRGLNAALPASNTEVGELRYSTDTKELYIDDGTTNVKIGGDPTGFPVSTATQTALDGKFTQRTITGTTNQVTVTNGDGVSGNPTLSLPQDIHTGATPTFARLIANGTTSSGTTSSIHTNWLTIFPANGATGNVKFFLNNGTQVWETFNNSSGVYGVYNNTAGTQPFDIKTNAADAGLSLQSAGPVTKNISPLTDSTYTLGTSSLYWSNTYTDRLYLNSTFNINGAVAGTGNITGNLGILATSGSATHSLTLGSTSTGIALYNTADQTTNYERLRLFTSGGTSYRLYAEQGGSGQAREIVISGLGISTQALALNVTSANGFVESRGTSATANAIIHRISGTLSSTSATQYGLSIVPTLGQSSTAGYTALLINPTQTSVGSGAKLLTDWQVGGTSLVKIQNDGLFFPVQKPTASAPTYVKGAIYFDTTLNKLMVGGATAWEVVTSV